MSETAPPAQLAVNGFDTTGLYERILFIEQGREREAKKNSWLRPLSLMLAAVIHITILTRFDSLAIPDIPNTHQESLLEVELVPAAIASETQAATISEPEEAKKEITPAPQPEPPIPVMKQAPEPHKAMQPQPPVPQPRPHPEPRPHKALQTASPVPAPVIGQSTTPAIQSPAETNRIKQLQQQYFATVMRGVEAHKIYPYAARRRHLEGAVDIAFLIDATGHISNIQISGESAPLRTASMEALNAAAPFPPLPEALTPPVRAHFIMQYKLAR